MQLSALIIALLRRQAILHTTTPLDSSFLPPSVLRCSSMRELKLLPKNAGLGVCGSVRGTTSPRSVHYLTDFNERVEKRRGISKGSVLRGTPQ